MLNRVKVGDQTIAYRVAGDAPGAGSSSDPPEWFTVTDWAQTLADFLDALGFTRAHVLGLSWAACLRRSCIASIRHESIT